MSRRMPVISSEQMARLLQQQGYFLDRQRGSHQIFVHPELDEQIVVPKHKELSIGIINNIYKTPGLTRKQFIAELDSL